MPEFPSFIDKRGARDKVLRASMLLVAAVTVALWMAVHFHGDVRCAAVLPVLALSGRPRFQRLIYPVPQPGGLGVHLTLDLQGQARFGPDVQWVDSIDYTVDPRRADAFYAEVRRYWPALPDGALQPGYAGIRPKLAGPEAPNLDFRIDSPAQHGVPGLVNLLGIESPGLTASLAVGDQVALDLAVTALKSRSG